MLLLATRPYDDVINVSRRRHAKLSNKKMIVFGSKTFCFSDKRIFPIELVLNMNRHFKGFVEI